MSKRKPAPVEAIPSTGERTAPHNIEAEKAVLGAIIVNNAAHEKAAPWLRRGRVFYRAAHRRVYEAILALLEEQRSAVDTVTLKEELGRRGALDDVGGGGYIAGLTDGVPRSANAAHYARIVYESAVRRDVIRISGEMLQDAYDGELSASSVVERADKLIVDLQRSRTSDRLVSMAGDMQNLYADFEWRGENQGKLSGVTTGFETLDQLTSGWQAGDLIVVGARPSMGKTAFMLNSLLASLRAGNKALVFSLEMRTRQLQYRLLSSMSQVPMSRILGGYTNDEEVQRLSAAFSELAQLGLSIDDRSGQSVHDMRSTCRQVRAESGLNLVVVDYIQLMATASDAPKGQNRNEILSDISRRFKLLADELALPVIVLSQLKRGEGRKPRLDDLKDSGALEQDADVAVLLHRRHHRASGKTLAMLEKQRNGPTGTINMTFERDTQTFTDAGTEVTGDDVPNAAPDDEEAVQAAKPARRYGGKGRQQRAFTDD